MTFDQYVSYIDALLRGFQAQISQLRYAMDEVTSGDYKNLPDTLTAEQLHRLRRSAFAAMNADWDLASARRALEGARDRLTRD
jgi:hypothetical protein